ncbi:MAG: hypothetical protein AAGA18_06300 [Verrucomicrobiota bacterium]
MNHFLLPVLIVISVFTGVCCAEGLAPTNLTVIVCDSTNKVLDTVIVPDDKKSRSVKFTLPEGTDEIRVFALGKRQHKDMQTGYYITGRPDDKKWMGLGYVEAHVEKGVLTGIDGNGFGQIKIDKNLKKQVLTDIKVGTTATITTVIINGEQGSGGNG